MPCSVNTSRCSGRNVDCTGTRLVLFFGAFLALFTMSVLALAGNLTTLTVFAGNARGSPVFVEVSAVNLCIVSLNPSDWANATASRDGANATARGLRGRGGGRSRSFSQSRSRGSNGGTPQPRRYRGFIYVPRSGARSSPSGPPTACMSHGDVSGSWPEELYPKSAGAAPVFDAAEELHSAGVTGLVAAMASLLFAAPLAHLALLFWADQCGDGTVGGRLRLAESLALVVSAVCLGAAIVASLKLQEVQLEASLINRRSSPSWEAAMQAASDRPLTVTVEPGPAVGPFLFIPAAVYVAAVAYIARAMAYEGTLLPAPRIQREAGADAEERDTAVRERPKGFPFRGRVSV